MGVLAAIADGTPDGRKLASQLAPKAEIFSDLTALVEREDIDAIALATPAATHFDLGRRVLAAGKDLFVEKPMASTVDEARRMVDEAARRRLILAVDHTFVHTGAVRKMREIVENGLGDVYYYDSVRVNLGLFQHDVSVVWDLAVHDLSIMDYVLPEKPVAVSATGDQSLFVDFVQSGLKPK